jgi:uncharacterized membrane protein YdjX (TVP38/TMEM64 family)
MTDNPKKTGPLSESKETRRKHPTKKSGIQLRTLLSNSQALIPLISGVIMVLTGLTLVGITILGLIYPLWISAILSLLGSISSMMGAFLIYHTITSQGSFEGLINQAIRRVIRSQN